MVIFDGSSVRIIPDILIPRLLYEGIRPSIIIPVLPILQRAIPVLTWPWKIEPTYQPGDVVYQETGNEKWEFRFSEEGGDRVVVHRDRGEVIARRQMRMVDGEPEEYYD